MGKESTRSFSFASNKKDRLSERALFFRQLEDMPVRFLLFPFSNRRILPGHWIPAVKEESRSAPFGPL
jgi:hypothetical protein